LKVLILGGDFNRSGGTERVGSMLANGLDAAGYDVVLGSLNNGDKPFFELNESITVRSLARSTGRAIYRMPNNIYNIRQVLVEENIDTLIVVETMLVLFTLPAAAGLSINHICWEHFNFKSDLGKKGRRVARQLAARYCDTVVTLTDRDRQYWQEGTRGRAKIVTISNPCPFPVQTNHKLPNSKTVLAVGNLFKIKGFDYLLKAWQIVTQSMPEWTLTIVGDGEERESLTQYITDHQLSKTVQLVGRTDNVVQYYNQADIYCLSSQYEGFPMVLLETLAFGIPVVSFDCDTGPAEILEDTGSILIPKNNIDKLAGSLVKMMRDDKLRKSISMRSKEKAEIYQTKKIISQWVNLIESLN